MCMRGGEGRVCMWGWGGLRWSCKGQCGLARCGPNLGFGYLCVYVGLGRDVMELWWEMGLTQWCAACFCGKADLFPYLSFGCHLDCVFIVAELDPIMGVRMLIFGDSWRKFAVLIEALIELGELYIIPALKGFGQMFTTV